MCLETETMLLCILEFVKPKPRNSWLILNLRSSVYCPQYQLHADYFSPNYGDPSCRTFSILQTRLLCHQPDHQSLYHCRFGSLVSSSCSGNFQNPFYFCLVSGSLDSSEFSSAWFHLHLSLRTFRFYLWQIILILKHRFVLANHASGVYLPCSFIYLSFHPSPGNLLLDEQSVGSTNQASKILRVPLPPFSWSYSNFLTLSGDLTPEVPFSTSNPFRSGYHMNLMLKVVYLRN